MLKICTDFNAVGANNGYWILRYEDCDLEDCAEELKLKVGQKVILYAAGENFEVVATLDFGYDPIVGRDVWTAVADMSTLVDK